MHRQNGHFLGIYIIGTNFATFAVKDEVVGMYRIPRRIRSADELHFWWIIFLGERIDPQVVLDSFGGDIQAIAENNPVCQLSSGRAPARIALLACRPVLYMAKKTIGISAATTVAIMRLRSSPSRTWVVPVVTLPGV